MKPYLVKTNINGYVKDRKTNAVLNTDEQAYIDYCANKKRVIELKTMKSKVDSMQEQINKLEALIKQVINGK